MFIVPLSSISPMGGIEPLSAVNGSNTVKETTDTDSATVESFGDTLKQALQGVRDLETESNQASYDLAMGKTDDIEGVMLTATKASTAIEMTVQLTTRAVNAYKDVLSMQI